MIEHHDDDLGARRDETGPEVSPEKRGLSVRTSRILALALALVAAASMTAGVFFYLALDRVDARLDERAAAARVAEQFTVQFNTYQPDSMDSYAESMNALLTTAARTKFESVMEKTVSAMQEAELESEGTVLASAVAHIDRDDATVLVVADAEADSVFGPRQRHFRWEVSLDKVDGEWLVDDFSPVQ